METTTGKNRDGTRNNPSEPSGGAKEAKDPQKKSVVTPQTEGERERSAGAVLGPDGEPAGRPSGEAWSEMPGRVGEYVKAEPVTAVLAALGFGLVVGAILGVILAND
ncbi:MAG: hypothetical protein ABI592_01340 [Acidobacteriota bacterium]